MYNHTKDESNLIKLGNNKALKTLKKTLTFVDADANTEGSTIALCERCSGKLKMIKIRSHFTVVNIIILQYVTKYFMLKIRKKNDFEKKNKTNTHIYIQHIYNTRIVKQIVPILSTRNIRVFPFIRCIQRV